MADKKFVRVAGTLVFTQNLTKVNEEFGGKYEATIANLSPKAVEQLEELGLATQVKDKYPEMGHTIKIKSKFKIDAVDENGLAMKDVMIGSGTKVIATIGFFNWTFKGKKGTSPTLAKLVVTDLVEYSPADKADAEEVL